MSPTKLSDTDRMAIVELYRQPGETTATVAERYGVSVSTISRLLKTALSRQEYDALIRAKRSGMALPEEDGLPAEQPLEDDSAIAERDPDAVVSELESPSPAAADPLPIDPKPEKPKPRRIKADPSDTPSAASLAHPTSAVPAGWGPESPIPDSSAPETSEPEDLVAEGSGRRSRPRRRQDTPPAQVLTSASASSASASSASEPSPPTVTPPRPEQQLNLLEALPLPFSPVSEATTPLATPSALSSQRERPRKPTKIVTSADTPLLSHPLANSSSDFGLERGRAGKALANDELVDEDLEDDLDDDLDDDDSLDDDGYDEGLDGEQGLSQALSLASLGVGGRSADEELQVLPLEEAHLTRMLYLVVDRMSELVTCPLSAFQDLGQVPETEEPQRTLPVFDNHRVARRFSRRNQRVIKVPDGRLLVKTAPWLEAKGITRLLLDGQVYALDE